MTMVLLFIIIMKFQLRNKNVTNNILEGLCFQKLLSLHERVLHTFHLQLLRVLYDVDVEEGGDQLRVTQVHDEHHSPQDDAHASCQINRQHCYLLT